MLLVQAKMRLEHLGCSVRDLGFLKILGSGVRSRASGVGVYGSGLRTLRLRRG